MTRAQGKHREFSLNQSVATLKKVHATSEHLYTYISLYRDVELNLSLRCNISSSCHAVNVSISLPLPKSTTG